MIEPNLKCVSCACRWHTFDVEDVFHFFCLAAFAPIDDFWEGRGDCVCYKPQGTQN